MQLDISNLGAEAQQQLAAILAQLQPNNPNSPNSPNGPNKKRTRKRATDTIKYLTESEMERFLGVIQSPRDLAIMTVGYKRGLRASEIGGIQLADLEMRDERLTIRRKKGSKGGQYHLTSKEIKALRAWLKVRGYEPGPLFPSRQGSKGISQQMLWVLMQKYGRLAGIPSEKCHPHVLKHSCATHLLGRGLTVEDIADHIGHRNVQNTLIYASFGGNRRIERDKRLREW